MPISTRVVELDADGSVAYTVAPCFFAGHDGGTVADSLYGTLATKYTSGTMPFIEGNLTVTGPADGEVTLFLDFSL